jgi:hypothetical protein
VDTAIVAEMNLERDGLGSFAKAFEGANDFSNVVDGIPCVPNGHIPHIDGDTVGLSSLAESGGEITGSLDNVHGHRSAYSGFEALEVRGLLGRTSPI